MGESFALFHAVPIKMKPLPLAIAFLSAQTIQCAAVHHENSKPMDPSHRLSSRYLTKWGDMGIITSVRGCVEYLYLQRVPKATSAI